VSSFASVVVSWYPHVALLKAISLLLLFLYCAAGGRLAILHREEAFVSGLLIGCEVITYASAVSSFVLRIGIFGNPNSLGAVMGIVVVPVLLWGVLVAQEPQLAQRRAVALLVALSLLLSSFARAGITAAAVVFVILCLGLRRYRLLVKGSVVAVLMAILILVVFPPEEYEGENSHGVVSAFIYKGKRDMGVLGSRRTAWQHTMGVIAQNPWFGSGFGTSLTAAEEQMQLVALASAPEATREHGSSYLAILEWVGVLGVVPFFALVFLSASNAVRVLTWMRRTGAISSPAVPIALVIAAGLVHAAFEDWLFAAGYYMSPLFWSFAFVCVDMIREIEAHERAVPLAAYGWAEMPPLVVKS
jgi:O-antigen ligase